MNGATYNFARSRRRRGAILILAMVIVFTLATVVLALCRSMQVEARASANQAAMLQASTIQRGAEQYVLGMLASYTDGAVFSLTEDYFAAVPLGDGYFWLLRPNYDDPSLPQFGLVDENSKLDLNEASEEQLAILFDDDILAQAIYDWRQSGAISTYYQSLPEPYMAKAEDYETVEEVLLVEGMTPQLLYGDGSAPPLGTNSNVFGGPGRTMYGDALLSRGFYDLLTVYSLSPTGGGGGGGGGGRNRPGRINVNTAPREVLLCIPNISSTQVDNLLTARASADMNSTDISWAQTALGNIPITGNNSPVTGQSLRYSADILAVTGNGRAFKRVRIVVDVSDTTNGPRIIYRRDLTDRGWPMDPGILAALREGQQL